jgi:DNA-binding MarR family transcriptional regulator
MNATFLSLLMRVSEIVRSMKAKEEGLAEREIVVLEVIERHKNGNLNISEIGKLVPTISQSAVSITISDLERMKLLKKVSDKRNQRIKYVILSSKGKQIIDNVRKARVDRITLIIEAMQLNEDEQRQFMGFLERMLAGIEKLNRNRHD